MKATSYLFIMANLIFTISLNAQDKGTFKDIRDGKTYKTIKIDKQTWFSENLNYETKGSYCYDDKASNCEKYGRLYNWTTAKTVCPTGWHLPSDNEWKQLTDFLGGESSCGCKMKESGLSHWMSPNSNSDNNSEFSALPSGCRINNGSYLNIQYNAYWWSNNEKNAENAWARDLIYNKCDVSRNNYPKKSAIAVRCLKDL